MASNNGMLVLLGAGAVIALVMGSSKKASASAPAKVPKKGTLGPGGRAPLAADKETVHVDADDGQPMSLPDVSMPAQSLATMAPTTVEMPPPRDEGIPVQMEIPEQPEFASPHATPAGNGRWAVTNDDGSPVVPSPAFAKQKAQSLADHVRTKRTKYDRPRLAVWQALAGIPVDGLYGPGTAKALAAMGAKNVPKPQFKGGA